MGRDRRPALGVSGRRAAGRDSASVIPQRIHQLWKTEDIPERFQGNAASWRRHHPGWTYRLWTDEAIDTFVREEYPDVWPLYRSYADQIQRVDAARYMILHRFGGLYSDLDIECLHPFDALCVHEAVLAGTTPYGLSNDLMMAAPGHPLFAALIRQLSHSQSVWGRWFVPRHFRILLTTASLHLTNVFRAFSDAGPVHILPPPQYSSQDRSRAWVYHWPGNTWAHWDTHFFVFVHRHWRWLTIAALLLLAATWWSRS